MDEYDVVKSVRPLTTNVPKDTIGTILLVMDSDNYEVEFVNEEGETLDVITVSKNEIVKVSFNFP